MKFLQKHFSSIDMFAPEHCGRLTCVHICFPKIYMTNLNIKNIYGNILLDVFLPFLCQINNNNKVVEGQKTINALLINILNSSQPTRLS